MCYNGIFQIFKSLRYPSLHSGECIFLFPFFSFSFYFRPFSLFFFFVLLSSFFPFFLFRFTFVLFPFFFVLLWSSFSFSFYFRPFSLFPFSCLLLTIRMTLMIHVYVLQHCSNLRDMGQPLDFYNTSYAIIYKSILNAYICDELGYILL